MKHEFSLFKNIIIPRNSRQVELLLPGSDERIVSDLVPTAALTETFPTFGVDTFADIDWTNKPITDEFSDYVVFHMTKEDGWLTRLWFARVRTDELTVPLQTVTFRQNHPWPAILKGVAFVPDRFYLRTDVNSLRDGAGFIMPRHTRPFGIPQAFEGTTVQELTYVSIAQPSTPRWPSPQTDSPSFEHNGLKERVPDVLHDNLTIGNEVFPRTNFKRWYPYVTEDKPEQRNGLWWRVVRRVIPPRPQKPRFF